MKPYLRIGLALLLVLSLRAVPAFSQAGTASLRGRATDSSGLAVVGVNVLAVSVDTNVSFPTSTNGDGIYNLPTLAPGAYRVRVEKQGFQSIERQGIVLHVADDVSLDFTLQVGAVTQTVTVTEEVPLVNTTNSELGGLVQANEVASLPLNGRNYINLTLLQPGIAPNISTPGGSINGTWFSSNGATIHSNNFLLDGAIMQEINGGSTANFSGRTLGLDGIQEYRVVTTSFTAEYGLLAGSQTIMVSKSGGNRFHGSAFEYLRNSVMDAANFFDRGVPANNFQRLPPYKRNNFGGSFGGPIRKDKTFFFATYEQLQERLGVTINDTVLAPSCHGALNTVVWNGQGTQPAGSQGPCTQLGTNPAGPGTNSVTIGLTSPAVAALVALIPLPNLPLNGFTTPYSQPESDRFGQIRVDQVFTDKDSAFVRYTIDDDDQVLGLGFPELFINPRQTRHQYATLGENHTLSTSLLNTFRFSFSRTASNRTSPDQFTGPLYSLVAGQPMGEITVGGIVANPSIFGPIANPPAVQIQNITTFSDDLIYTLGRHSFKFGALINSYRDYGVQNMKVEGTLAFSTIANFLAGTSSSYTAVLPPTIKDRTIQFYTTGFYAQDEWRLRHNFTLDYGLRYEPSPNYMTEVHGISSSIRNVLTDSTATVGPLFPNPTLHNFSPRLGFAWDVFGNGKTSVRGGAGLLYNLGDIWNGAVFNIQNAQIPYSFQYSKSGAFTLPFNFGSSNPVATSASTDQWNFKQERFYRWNLTVERQLPFDMALSLSYTGSRGEHLPSIWEGDPNTPAGFTNGVPFWPSTFTAQCSATVITKCLTKLNPNAPWQTVSVFGSNGDSIYHGAQVSLVKHMTHGLQFQSSFTWSKILDDTEGNSTSDQATGVSTYPSDPFNPHFDYGPASFNIPFIWAFNTIYNIPAPKFQERFVAGLTSGWGVTGIYSLRSGFPFSPIDTGVQSHSTNGVINADRPNILPGRSIYSVTHGVSTGCGSIPAGTPLGTPTLFFDPCAFQIQPAGTLGNVERDGFVGPGLNQLDFAVKKDTRLGFLGEAGNLTFRAELFNIFNHPNFNPPAVGTFGTSLANPATVAPINGAGQITTTGANTSRQIELSLRVIF